MKMNARKLAGIAVLLVVAVGCEAESQSQQQGNNHVEAVQSMAGTSGDAVPGSQVTGVVGLGTVQILSSVDGAEATSGDVFTSNTLSGSLGPSAEASNRIEDTLAVANAQQLGDNWLRAEQYAVGNSGDAVAGAQVTGIVSETGFVVQNSLSALNPDADSGTVSATNEGTYNLGPRATASDGNVSANAQQVGDNRGRVAQRAEGQSGTANAGSQVTGAQGSGTSQGTASSNGSSASSGSASGSNSADFDAGPRADAGS